MVTYLLEAGNSLSIYLGVTLVFGGAIFYRAKKKHVEKEIPFWGGLFVLFVLEVLCFATLRSLLGLAVFSLACLFYCFYIPAAAMLPVDRKAVLITGSDSGIGHELAKFLDRSGFVVFAGVLNERGPGAELLRRTSSERLSVLQLDITDSQQIQEAFLEVKKLLKNAALWGIVNNAGILGFPADAELLPMSNYKRCMEVNFFGPVEVSKTFMPLLRKSKGRLINISSMAGSSGLYGRGLGNVVPDVSPAAVAGIFRGIALKDRDLSDISDLQTCGPHLDTERSLSFSAIPLKMPATAAGESSGTTLPRQRPYNPEDPLQPRVGLGGVPMPKFAAYGASKAALSMFSGVMRQELSKWGIKVAVVHPSAFRTSIQGTPEQWSQLEQNLLEKLTPHVKEDYGEDYILALKNVLAHIPISSRPDLSPVLLDVLHALLAIRPHGLYTPGKCAYKYLFIFHYFPLWFYDRCMRQLEQDSYEPKALKATQTKNKRS